MEQCTQSNCNKERISDRHDIFYVYVIYSCVANVPSKTEDNLKKYVETKVLDRYYKAYEQVEQM